MDSANASSMLCGLCDGGEFIEEGLPSKMEVEPKTGSEEDALDSLSEASEGPDAADVEVDPKKTFITYEDESVLRIQQVAALLRDRPLWPTDPRDAKKSYTDAQSGVRLPLLHCAFKECCWHADLGSTSDGGVGLGRLRQWSVEFCL